MKIRACRWIASALFILSFWGAAAVAQTAPGVIKAGKVEGEVFRLTADGQSLAVKAGDTLIETDTVTTGTKALVVLVFMNGSSVKLGPESKLKIEEFKMDPLGEDIAVAGLAAEPSVSKTVLNLAQGEMVGEVKKLNRSSSYNIRTPVGAAGIRGTTFRIVFRPTGDGRSFTFQLATAEGVVVFEGTTAAPANVPVPDNQEIVVTAEATLDTTTGAIQVANVEVPAAAAAISPDARASIVQAVATVITEAVQATTITISEQQQQASTQTTPSQQSSPPAAEEKKEETKQEETKKEEPPQEPAATEQPEQPKSSSEPATGSTDTPAQTGGATQTGGTTLGNSQPPTTPAPTAPAAPTTRPPSLTPGAGG